MKKTSRLLSLLLTVLMMVGMVSVGIGSQTASALTTSASTWTSVGWTYTDNVNNAISSISWDMVSGDAITCGVIYMRLQAVVTWGDVVAQINGRNPSSSTLLNKNNTNSGWPFYTDNADETYAWWSFAYTGIRSWGLGTYDVCLFVCKL